jgi:tetratricopeptide (TPR) repeat protein
MIKKPRYMQHIIITGLVLICCLITYFRNFVWQNEISLWEDVVQKSPNNARPHNNLGLAYRQIGLTDKAISQYKECLRLNPYVPEAYNGLGVCYSDKGWLDEAIIQFKYAIIISPWYGKAHFNLGLAYGLKGINNMAFHHLKIAKELLSKNEWEAVMNVWKSGLKGKNSPFEGHP